MKEIIKHSKVSRSFRNLKINKNWTSISLSGQINQGKKEAPVGIKMTNSQVDRNLLSLIQPPLALAEMKSTGILDPASLMYKPLEVLKHFYKKALEQIHWENQIQGCILMTEAHFKLRISKTGLFKKDKLDLRIKSIRFFYFRIHRKNRNFWKRQNNKWKLK